MESGEDALFESAARHQRQPTAQRWLMLAPYTLAYLVYCVFHLVAWPFLGIRSLKRAKKRDHRGLILQRLLGGSKPPHRARWVVIAAGGLGEKRAGFAFAEKIIAERNPDVGVCVQSHNASKLTHATVACGVLPFNNPISTLIFLWRWRPQAILAVEFWDNHHLKAQARLMGVKTAVFNVPITYGATRQITFQSRWRYRFVGVYCCQAKEHRRRMKTAKIPDDCLVVTGPIGIKVDPVQGLTQSPEDVRVEWQERLGISASNFPVVVAGSTYKYDETVVLEAFAKLRSEFPHAALILAPRGVRRPGGCDSTLLDYGLDFVRRSEANGVLPTTNIVLIDTFGDLKYLYSVGHMAFVGGTFGVQGTGHTPVEAMAWKLPITMGPDYPQQKTVVDLLLNKGLVRICRSTEELAQTWTEWARNADERARIARETEVLLATQDDMILRIYDNLLS